MSLSTDSLHLKRIRESDASEPPAKKARLSASDAIHELVAISEHDFSSKQVTDITKAFEVLKGEVSHLPKDQLKRIGHLVFVIQDRISHNANMNEADKALLFTQIKESQSLVKAAKLVADIPKLWQEEDIQLLEDGTSLRFSPRIANRVNNGFLKSLFTCNCDIDFTNIKHFDFAKYPKLNAETLVLLDTYCPQFFRDTTDYTFLNEPRFCDHLLVIGDLQIPVNRWFIQNQSGYIRDVFEEYGFDSGRTEITPPINIASRKIAQALDCLHQFDLVKNLTNRQELFQLLQATTFLDIPPIVAKLDASIASCAVQYLRQPVDPNWQDDGIRFIQQFKVDFHELVKPHILPKTCDILTEITSRIFDFVCSKDANYRGSFYNGSNEALSNKLSVWISAYELLGPTNILANFSAAKQYDIISQYFSIRTTEPRSQSTLVKMQQFLELCVQYNPGDSSALAFLALQHQWGTHPDKYVQAKKAFERLRDLDALDDRSRCAFAELLFKGGQGVERDPIRAIALLKNAIEKKPTAPLVYVTLAHLMRASGKKDEALSLLNQFADTTKDYSKTVIKSPQLIRFYALYCRALEGETFTEEYLDENNLLPDLLQFAFIFPTLGKIFEQSDRPVPDYSEFTQTEKDEIFAFMQRLLFDSTFPLCVDVMNHESEKKREFLFQDLRIKSMFT